MTNGGRSVCRWGVGRAGAIAGLLLQGGTDLILALRLRLANYKQVHVQVSSGGDSGKDYNDDATNNDTRLHKYGTESRTVLSTLR